MLKNMKKLFIILFSIILSSTLFAMPGFSSYIEDQAGEFVYYRDYSFENESYVGILEYDSKSFQLRYYSPATKIAQKKIVATLVTVDVVNGHFDLTGEKILIADYNNPDDVDIINYLHDLIYEFALRRCKHFEISPTTKGYVNFDTLKTNGLIENTNYPQFGGNVNIIYDCIIPFFNIKRIEDPKGKILFECVELGKIKTAEETLFDAYQKIPPKIKVKTNSKKIKAAPEEFIINNQRVVLDTTWEKKLDYMYIQNEDAIITLMTYNVPKERKDEYYYQYFLIRSFLECKDDNFVDYTTADVIFTGKGFKLYSDTYTPNVGKVYYTAKFITSNKNNDYDYLSFAATRGAYQIKQSYYDKILRSYSNDN